VGYSSNPYLVLLTNNGLARGTYCAAVIMSLLDLPLELPPGSIAKLHETDNLLTRMPEYVSRCVYPKPVRPDSY
jgi:hypothetical protein